MREAQDIDVVDHQADETELEEDHREADEHHGVGLDLDAHLVMNFRLWLAPITVKELEFCLHHSASLERTLV